MGADVREGSRATSPASADSATAQLERRCEELQSDNARLRRELKEQHAKTEQILAHLEQRVECLHTLLVDVRQRHAAKPSPSLRTGPSTTSVLLSGLLCVVLAAAAALAPPWKDGDAGGGREVETAAVACTGPPSQALTLALGPAPAQPLMDAEEAGARLAQRAADLTAALANAFVGGSERGDNAEAAQWEAAKESMRCGIARSVVHDALLEREGQLINGTQNRAAALHFAGDPKRREQVLRNFAKMTHAIERFVHAGPGEGRTDAALHIDEGAWGNAGGRVAAHVAQYPQSVVVFHDADKANPERLSELEEAFEAGYLVHQGRRVDCTGAVFILYTFLGASLSSHVCSDKLGNRLPFCSSATHKAELVRVVKEQSQHVWPEWTFVARISAVAPFP
eukprot:Tamp_14851.p1 GENE.Tamp_14851~~Tamp_14851.p1  ORF type:complete len:396 (+),score=78.08 Tamp_14851:198-1385(+)